MNMKICTITCHDVYNYGASLQAYALQKFLQLQGHNVEIIDYKPSYEPRYPNYYRLAPSGFLHKIASIFPFLEVPLAIWQNRKNIKYQKRVNAFISFKKQYLQCSSSRYRTFDELQKNKPKADLYIAGSDQIWNTNYENGKDPAFYCAFEKDPRKCISYAASFATDTIDDKYKDFVIRGLSNFKSISVREETGTRMAQSLGFSATQVLDPVFLFETQEWVTFCRKTCDSSRYVLVYDLLNNDPLVETIVKKVSKERSIKIYSLNGTFLSYADKNITDAGPIEFVEWIKNAEFIVSTSFHATAFSVIFNKDFYTLQLRGFKNSSRMRDFCNMLKIGDRYITSLTDRFDVSEHIDYNLVNQQLSPLVEKSRKWLIENIIK